MDGATSAMAGSVALLWHPEPSTSIGHQTLSKLLNSQAPTIGAFGSTLSPKCEKLITSVCLDDHQCSMQQ